MMTKRLLLLVALSSVTACSDPPTLRIHSEVSTHLQPGESGTLVQIDDRHWIEEMALSDNYLFFAVAWSGVYRMPKYGGDIVALEEDPHGQFYHVATEGDRVYWIHVTFDARDYPHTQVRSQRVDGGPITTLVEGNFGIFSSSQSDEFQARGGYVYWAADTGGGTPGVIERVSAAGGPREAVRAFPVPPDAPFPEVPYWVGDGSSVYYTSAMRGGDARGGCAIEQVSAPGQTPDVLADCPEPATFAVAVDDDYVYLQSTGTMWRMSKLDRTISAIEILPAGSYFGWSVEIDESNVYATTARSPNTIFSFPKVGGTMTTIADAGSSMCTVGVPFMVVDGEYVFKVCDNQNTIKVFPRLMPQLP
jgi:hypothetical protein